MTEVRRKELAEKWWCDRLLGIEDFIKIVAAEAREEMRDIICRVPTPHRTREYLDAIVERLKE